MKWAFALAVIGIVGYEVWSRLTLTDFEDVTVSWPWLAGAVLALPGMYACIALSERMLLESVTDRRLTLRELIPAAWVPLAGKYVPGKVAAAGAAVVLLKRLGVPATTALGVFVLLDAMPVLTGTVLGSALLLEDGVRERFPSAAGVFVAVFAGGVICLSPTVFRPMTTLALKLMGRPPLPRTPGWKDYVGPVLCSLGQWAFNGLAVWLAMRAFQPELKLLWLPWTACATALTMCLSYFAAFITPSGLGLREGTFIALLSPVVGLPAATATAVAMRLNHTLVEAALCGIGLLVLRSGGRRA